jgi:hypothetical protein
MTMHENSDMGPGLPRLHLKTENVAEAINSFAPLLAFHGRASMFVAYLGTSGIFLHSTSTEFRPVMSLELHTAT